MLMSADDQSRKITAIPIQYQIINEVEMTVYFAVIQAVFWFKLCQLFLASTIELEILCEKPVRHQSIYFCLVKNKMMLYYCALFIVWSLIGNYQVTNCKLNCKDIIIKPIILMHQLHHSVRVLMVFVPPDSFAKHQKTNVIQARRVRRLIRVR